MDTVRGLLSPARLSEAFLSPAWVCGGFEEMGRRGKGKILRRNVVELEDEEERRGVFLSLRRPTVWMMGRRLLAGSLLCII